MFAIGGMLKLPRICSSGLPTFLSEKKSLPLEKQDFLKGNLGHMHMVQEEEERTGSVQGPL